MIFKSLRRGTNTAQLPHSGSHAVISINLQLACLQPTSIASNGPVWASGRERYHLLLPVTQTNGKYGVSGNERPRLLFTTSKLLSWSVYIHDIRCPAMKFPGELPVFGNCGNDGQTCRPMISLDFPFCIDWRFWSGLDVAIVRVPGFSYDLFLLVEGKHRSQCLPPTWDIWGADEKRRFISRFEMCTSWHISLDFSRKTVQLFRLSSLGESRIYSKLCGL